MQRVIVLLPLLVLASCSPGVGQSSAPPPTSQASIARKARTETTKADGTVEGQELHKGAFGPLFDELLANVRRSHVFAEGQAAAFEGALERLRREALEAETEAQALVALNHLERALGDRHCNLAPAGDVRQARLGLGISLHTEREAAGKVRVRIDEIEDPALEAKLRVGDELLVVDGVPVGQWLADHPFESNALNPEARLSETARSIVAQVIPWTTTKEGQLRKLSFANAGETALPFRRPFRYERESKQPDLDASPPMASISCTQEPKSPYSGYELASVGVNYCTYRPSAGNRGAQGTRIVRFLSFWYSGRESSTQLRMVKVDHDGLARDLAGARRVVLDLHENHGGNNPFVFLSWFAKKPWQHEMVTVRVGRDFAEDDVRNFLFGDGELVKRYLAAAQRGESWLTYPFLCKGEGCDGMRGPRPAEHVTEAPVGLVTGPECTSSCDAFSVIWSTYGMGPIVGKQPMHGFTSVRHDLPMRGPNGRSLGLFRIALSHEGFPGKPPLEGTPIQLDWQAPETFATRSSWLDASVVEVASRLAVGGGPSHAAR